MSNVNFTTRVPDTAVYVGGNFTQAGGQTHNYITRWDGNAIKVPDSRLLQERPR